MKKLGILINSNERDGEQSAPSYPLLAFSYYRSGYIRLAGMERKPRK
ncbi:MAG: hypothetical protein KKA60_13710 [Proteobacteria bacterium]|nr:hypothetical protein [Pseudomonadota bacterium]